MSDAADSWTRDQRLRAMNDNVYDPVSNPMGWNGDGHRALLPRLGIDLADASKAIADDAAIAAAAASQSGAWVKETAPVAFQTASTLQITGVDRTTLAKPGRAIFVKLDQTVCFGTVSSAAVMGGNTVLGVTMQNGQALDATLSELDWGQDPDNAPQSNAKKLAIIFG